MSSAANRRPDNIALCQSRTIAELGKQVAAKQGLAHLFIKNAGVPTVGYMRRVDVADPLAFTQIDDFTVVQDLRRAVGHVVQ